MTQLIHRPSSSIIIMVISLLTFSAITKAEHSAVSRPQTMVKPTTHLYELTTSLKVGKRTLGPQKFLVSGKKKTCRDIQRSWQQTVSGHLSHHANTGQP